jgi:septum formation protein
MLVLASNSPRRRHLLALGGWSFMTFIAEVDERPLPGEAPKDYVLRLAENKARAVASRVPSEALIIAADTAVVDGGEILGKPADAAEAEAMLRRLRGRTHQVYTALAVLRNADGLLLTDWCMTEVRMRQYSDGEIQAYVESGDPLDKAGAYAIQHRGFQAVESLNGCYASVMGLPLCHLTRTLLKLGLSPRTHVPRTCQQTLDYDCPIYREVLEG